MCGIIACRTHAPAIDYLLTALRRLEYRGYDSVGVAVQTTSGDVVRLRTVGRVGALLSLESIENCWLTWRNPIISHLNTFTTNPRIGSPTKEGGSRVSLRRRRCKCGECGRKTSKPTHVYEYGDDDRIRIVCPDCMAQYLRTEGVPMVDPREPDLKPSTAFEASATAARSLGAGVIKWNSRT
jgi:hypothetical protein